MNAIISTPIDLIETEGKNHRLSFLQITEGSDVRFRYSVILEHEAFEKLSKVLTLVGRKDEEVPIEFMLTSMDTLKVTFPIDGCFGHGSFTQSDQMSASVQQACENRAIGISSLTVFSCESDQTENLPNEYFVSADTFNLANKLLDFTSSASLLFVRKNGICYSDIYLKVKNTKITNVPAKAEQKATVGSSAAGKTKRGRPRKKHNKTNATP